MKTILLILLIVFSFSTFAQMSISITTGYNPKNISPEEIPPDGWNASWDYGFTLGINAGYFLSPNFLLSASLNYSHYNFEKYISNMWAIPEIHFISSAGEDSKIYRISIEAKYFPFLQNKFRFFIFSGLGYITENMGVVKATYYNDLNNKETTYINKRPDDNHLAHSLGIGIRPNIFSNIHFELSVFYYSNYWDWWQPTINIGLGYNFYL